MDNQAKNFSEAIQKRQRLPQRPAMPEVRDLLGLLAEAEKLRGKMLEVPWQEPGVPDLLVLCVEFEIGSTMPVWSLYQGDAGESRLVWSCRETDMYLLYDLLCMFMSQLRPKVPEPQPVAEASAGDAPQEVADNLTPIDYSLFAERPNVMLGYLLVGAGIIPEPVIDAALKVQEMVRNADLTPEQACDTLRRTYQRANPGSAKPAAKAEATPQPKPQQQAKPQSAPQPKAQAQPQPKPVPQPSVAASATRKDYSEAKQVCEFLLQAGIVSTEDVEAASRLKKREGGELELLVSAGTIDKRTHEAALSCWRMIKDNLLKTEQGIIALHYCQRMRVSLPEAFMELGWHYPK